MDRVRNTSSILLPVDATSRSGQNRGFSRTTRFFSTKAISHGAEQRQPGDRAPGHRGRCPSRCRPVRGLEIGSELLERLTAAAGEQRVGHAIVFSASIDWQQLVPFYARHGFKMWFFQMFK